MLTLLWHNLNLRQCKESKKTNKTKQKHNTNKKKKNKNKKKQTNDARWSADREVPGLNPTLT